MESKEEQCRIRPQQMIDNSLIARNLRLTEGMSGVSCNEPKREMVDTSHVDSMNRILSLPRKRNSKKHVNTYIMKKQIALFCAAMGLGVASFAQDVTFGPMAGLNYSIISTSIDPEPDDYEKPDNASGVGFFLGGFVNIGLSDKFAIRPELHFSARGVQSDEEYTETTTILGQTFTTEVSSESKSTDNFIEIPILANLMLSETFNIHVGPSVGLLIGGKSSFEGSTTTNGVTTEIEGDVEGSDYTEGRNGFELGFAAGFAYETEGGLGIGFRYTRGLTSTLEETEIGDTKFSSNYNLFQLFASYTLGK